MAKPPATAITITRNNKQLELSYFEHLTLIVHDLLSSEGLLEKDGLKLNIKGYTETVEEYKNLEENNLDAVWQLAKDLNAWSDYLSSMANLIQKYYLDSETEKAQMLSVVSINADHERVSNGKRIADQDKKVVSVRKKRNVLQSYYNELESKVKFLERAHYHCKSTYDSAMKKYVVDKSIKESSTN